MKKVILFSVLVVVLLLAVGCEELTEEEKEILGEEGAAIAGQAYNQGGVKECRRDNECWQSLLSCYRAECSNLPRGENQWDECIDSCLARAQGDECVPKTRDDCVHQEYAGGVYECGEIDDGCGGTVNCDMQAYAGGVACPNNRECGEDNLCVQECVPKTRDDCIHQEYAGGVYQCGEIDDGCGGTVNCNMQAYAGGIACPGGAECGEDNICARECVPKTREDCIRQEYAGGIIQCGEVDDGCGGTVNCDWQAYAGGLACSDGAECGEDNLCPREGNACDETFTILEGESYDLAEAGTLTMIDMLYQDYAGGVHSATFCVTR
tara:strand:- start:94 stop:1059 length:966 start_codon:yes stop_codon:yes gene_type:complete